MPCTFTPNAVANGLVVGVSGGVDSVVLLHALVQTWRTFALTTPLVVAHVNYQLRRSARGDEKFVARLAASYQLPYVCLRVSPRQHPKTGNLQAWAREVRYQFFAKIAAARKITHIAVAHTATDQAETVLMHLLQGAGLEGLAGMRPSRGLSMRATKLSAHAPRNQRMLIRPLLNTTREEILGYARRAKLRFREDPTNASPKFLRNRIRHSLLPALTALEPRAVQHLAKSAAILAHDAEWIAAHIPTLLRQLAPRAYQRGMSVDRAQLRGLTCGLRHRIYRHIAAQLGSTRLNYEHVLACDHVLAEARMCALPGPLAFDARHARVRMWPGKLPTDTRE